MSPRACRRSLAAFAGLALLVAPLRVNTTPSLPRGLYLEIPRVFRSRPPARGDLVLVCPPVRAAELARRRGYLGEGPCPAGTAGGAAALGKIVLAVGGDEVFLNAGGIRVNGRSIPASRVQSQDGRNRPLAHYPFGTTQIPVGSLWLFAPFHARSFDSRYFGPVKTCDVRGWLIPVGVLPDDRFRSFTLHLFRASVA
jgi:conjugative transfer signal peptidase TraF